MIPDLNLAPTRGNPVNLEEPEHITTGEEQEQADRHKKLQDRHIGTLSHVFTEQQSSVWVSMVPYGCISTARCVAATFATEQHDAMSAANKTEAEKCNSVKNCNAVRVYLHVTQRDCGVSLRNLPLIFIPQQEKKQTNQQRKKQPYSTVHLFWYSLQLWLIETYYCTPYWPVVADIII